ncbi:CAP domain-containing protein [Candidatus Methylacidiphilum infernorum]|nr:CAP domain-containing protein [Candidatus Methylacidiphilum infernorum]
MKHKKIPNSSSSYRIFLYFFIFHLVFSFDLSEIAIADSGHVSSFSLAKFRQLTLALINQFREDNNLPPLVANPRLDQISQQWAEHIALEKKLVHRSLSSLKEITQDEGWAVINENLHYSTEGIDPQETVLAWEKSPGHRKNLLEAAIQIAGIGAAQNGRSGYVVFNGASIRSSHAPLHQLPFFFKKIFPGRKEHAEDPGTN